MNKNSSFLPIKLNNIESNLKTIEKKLNNQNTTLEDLLQEENIISEFRNQNEKLINFFSKDKVKKLVDYIIKEPKEDDLLKGHKFPFIASEILNSDEDKIVNYFILNKSEEEFNLKKKNKKTFDNIDLFNDHHNENKRDNNKDNYNKIEMFDYFLTFLETKKDLNYVLTGYFSKFFQIILTRKPIKILNYLFREKKDTIKQLIYHCNRKSICDIFIKLLNFDNLIPNMSSSVSINFAVDNTDNYYYNIDDLNSERTEILNEIFSFLKVKENPEKISNIILMLTELFENKTILDEIINSKKIFNSIFKELKVDLNSNENINNTIIKSNYSEILSLLTYMISNTQTSHFPKNEICQDDDMVEIGGQTNKKIVHTNLSENFFSTFNNLIHNFKQNKETLKKLISIPTSYNNIKIKPLGSFRIKIIELFGSFFPYLKNISFKYDEMLISSNFFSIAFNYLFTYEWNNLYQLSFLNLLKNYLKDANLHRDLSVYLFEKLKIIEIIKVHITNDKISNKFKFNSNNKCSHGYYSFLISLSYKINSVIGGTPLKLLSYSREGSICFINKTNKNENKNTPKDRYVSSEFNLSTYSKPFIRKNTCDSLKKYYSEDWNKFFNENISNVVQLYENKLLSDNFVNEFYNDNSISKNEMIYSNNNDELYNSDEIDLSDFVFVDEVKGSQKEEDIRNNIRSNLKVDELEMKNENK